MAGRTFLLDELIIASVLILFLVVSYTLLLCVAVRFQVSDKLENVLAILQLGTLSCTPIALTFCNRVGLTDDAFGVRFLEELGLYSVRYRWILRPTIGYIGAWIDMIVIHLLTDEREETNWHLHGLERCTSGMQTSWTSIFVENDGPVTLWRTTAKRLSGDNCLFRSMLQDEHSLRVDPDDIEPLTEVFYYVTRGARKELAQLEALVNQPRAPMEPYERITLACHLGKLHENMIGKPFKPYADVVRCIKQWVTSIDIPTVTQFPIEGNWLEAAGNRQVLQELDERYASERKEMVREIMKPRMAIVKSLMTNEYDKQDELYRKQLRVIQQIRLDFILAKLRDCKCPSTNTFMGTPRDIGAVTTMV